MKELKLYKCEFCGTQYKDKIECKKCEESHQKIKKVEALQYLPYKNDRTGKPSKIKVIFTNGSVAIYNAGKMVGE